ncbi:aminotransferase class V-fold PLP-dependent enzyme [Clostridium sp. 'White wine YQ']|uniref:aminotransferase class V-fold PLP-dependent enzyme n=1 Tax=Clostridium sp. 'White wine YQ' TaxID=3027474 RepID=UPI002366FD3D|nr:aminotransferase class V-fold PLP-dependent enzyme [Clostridium sp. 'White wine YQ']MDD7795757.1 aminotransferase class V-fold PLP-dependent enzyme [Clostridium sp. 'White wine YQ']
MISNLRKCFFGTDTLINTHCGFTSRVYLNNAATPLVAKPAIQELYKTLPIYSYGNEPNALSTQLNSKYNEVRNIVMNFIGADSTLDTVIFTPNTTSAINILSQVYYEHDPNQVILATKMEHMANYLPFREKMKTLLVGLTPEGNVDMNDYAAKLEQYSGQIKLVTVTGASNITGIIPPFYDMATMAHNHGAKILVDAVQLVQHKNFTMKPHDDASHIDFVSFDGHKFYTGQSGGVLVGDKVFLDQYKPLMYGAGITEFVSNSKIIYKDSPERYESGYPDFLGIISFGATIRFLQEIGMKNVEEWEQGLYRHLISRLSQIPNLILYGDIYNNTRTPFASFNLRDMSYHTLARWLGYEYGIDIAWGTNGSNLYVQELLGLTDEQAFSLYRSGEEYGIVRASIGLFNNYDDIDRLADALYCISSQPH